MAAAPSIIAGSLWPEATVERSIFGTDNAEAIWRQVLNACPDAADCFAFAVSIGALFGVLRRDGSRIAVKIHTDAYATSYLEAAQGVQEHLWRRRFPCPRPLGVRGRATLEEWKEDGLYRDAHEPEVRRALATALARLIALTGEIRPAPDLVCGFSFPGPDGPLWPTPHNVLFDFEAASAGAEWIDDLATVAQQIRNVAVGREVIAHADWSVKHFRFEGARPSVVYDWDSLVLDREPNVLGSAAATFTYTELLPVELLPTADETLAFIDEYEAVRGSRLSHDERRATHGAAVYSRAYGTRCGHAVGAVVDRRAVEAYAEALV
jgi:hypothetical protein